jgi:chemotaxis protein CheC
LKSYDHLSEIQKDVLREIGNIGGGNAATALSSIMTDKIDMTVPDLKIVDINQMVQILGGPENEVVGILVSMADDVRGMLLFLLDRHFTRLLINTLLGKNIENFENINEMDLSALKEIGNILAGSYINAISTMTGLRISLSPPDVAIDMVGAVLSYPAALFGMMSDKVLYIEEDFLTTHEDIKTHLLIMPEMESLQIMMERLGVV